MTEPVVSTHGNYVSLGGTTNSRGNDAGEVVAEVAGISGTYKTYILDPDDDDAADAAAERINDATGFKAFRVTPLTPYDGNSILAIVYGWSITPGDLTAVNALMSALDVDITTPSGAGQANENTGALFPVGVDIASTDVVGFTPSMWVNYDGTNLIKTIAVRASGGAYTTGVLVEVIA